MTTSPCNRRDGRTPVRLIMERLAAGDRAALVTLINDHGGALATVARDRLREIGVTPHPELIGELIVELAVTLAEVAAAWDPDGALPWVWARRRLQAAVDGHVGLLTVELAAGRDHADDARDIPEPAADGDLLEAFLTSEDPRVARIRDAILDRVGTAELRLWLEYRDLQAAGCPAPAQVLATRWEVRPETIRKRISRTNARIGDIPADGHAA